MTQKRLKHVEVEELTHRKLKIYSLLTGTPMHNLADEAINKYIEQNPLSDGREKIYQKLLQQK